MRKSIHRPTLLGLGLALQLSLGLLGLSSQVSAATAQSIPSALAVLEGQLQRQDFAAAEPALQTLLKKRQPSAAERTLIYQWLQLRDDQAAIERRSQAMLRSGQAAATDWLAAGRQALDLRRFDEAERCFKLAGQAAKNRRDLASQANALRGLGLLAYQRRQYDESLQLLQQSVAKHDTADNQLALAETLIRLGKTDAAISAIEHAIVLNPDHEMAHYYLGNGYARLNYTQLAAQNRTAFEQANNLVLQASEAFNQGDFARARVLAVQALARCPAHGRAHAVLAKALESQRLLIEVHRADAERRFAATPMPAVPGIERYVLNWAELSPRHQKRVALSIAPWKAFIPVLVAGGATHYIKPLAMRLSETPEAQALKDQRIDYDSRLWDDVRGMGGHNTVTGIEDVERSIFDRYNTVLHELSHQVHGVLTADQWRQIQELYSQAKQRDARTQQGFLSRYAGGSVWEYFAEGANALDSPRRDAYDSREIVRERLTELDPALQAYVASLFAMQDASASLPIALVNAGHHLLSQGKLDEAVAKFEQASAAAPSDESVLAARLHALALRRDATAVKQLAHQAQQLRPNSGKVRSAIAEALWHSGVSLDTVVAGLAQNREALQGDDQRRNTLELADYELRLGRADAALKHFEELLGQQADHPEGLWGKAASLAMLKRWDEAFASYDQALRLRTGLVALRADLLSQLLLAGRLDAARSQLKEALLLDATDATLLAEQAWLSLAGGQAEEALNQATATLQANPWSDLALIVKAAAERSLKRDAEATLAPLRQRIADGTGPSYRYDAANLRWKSIQGWTAADQRVFDALLSEPAR
ncbi:tetratricopeptide repeat protein [Paucibacter sp. APW11]|uniref:Tetratricopeptide repeat protein n=1 Tax=Roseateles aquae TaxID=3077235 RepID=A0ABU3P9U7_9BURK|nr:tetratricopeptide repeat protein [Paucibacter sp. APW11]MDT8999052.1 tetratricopeptide repeat protein [Paucibacter sp. APW11]